MRGVCVPMAEVAQKAREPGVGSMGPSFRLTILRLQFGPLAGEVIDRTLGLLSLAAVLIHLVFQGPAHLLQVGLEKK